MFGSVNWLENLSSVGAATVLTIVEVIGDRSAKLNGPIPVFISYNAVAYILPHVLRKNPLGLVNGYWNAMTNIADLGIGYYYGERLEPIQIGGLVLVSAGIAMMGMGKQTL